MSLRTSSPADTAAPPRLNARQSGVASVPSPAKTSIVPVPFSVSAPPTARSARPVRLSAPSEIFAPFATVRSPATASFASASRARPNESVPALTTRLPTSTSAANGSVAPPVTVTVSFVVGIATPSQVPRSNQSPEPSKVKLRGVAPGLSKIATTRFGASIVTGSLGLYLSAGATSPTQRTNVQPSSGVATRVIL